MRISDWSSDVCSSDLFEHDLSFGVAIGRLFKRAAGQGLTQLGHLGGRTGEIDIDAVDLLHSGQLRGRDRKSVVEGKSVSVRVDLGGRRIIKKKKDRPYSREVKTNVSKRKKKKQ